MAGGGREGRRYQQKRSNSREKKSAGVEIFAGEQQLQQQVGDINWGVSAASGEQQQQQQGEISA